MKKMPTPCVDGPGERTRLGYVRIWKKGRRYLAHRVAYEARFGPVPDGLELDHLCGNRWCRAPEHLEAVTHAENCRRKSNLKLSREKVAEIRRLWETGTFSKKGLGRMFSVSDTAVIKVLRGELW